MFKDVAYSEFLNIPETQTVSVCIVGTGEKDKISSQKDILLFGFPKIIGHLPLFLSALQLANSMELCKNSHLLGSRRAQHSTLHAHSHILKLILKPPVLHHTSGAQAFAPRVDYLTMRHICLVF